MELDHGSLKETLQNLIGIASEQEVTVGVDTVKSKHSSADNRWLQLKASCEERAKSAERMKNLFLGFDKQVCVVEIELNRIESCMKAKVVIGTDSKKMDEEVERMKVFLLSLYLYIISLIYFFCTVLFHTSPLTFFRVARR